MNRHTLKRTTENMTAVHHKHQLKLKRATLRRIDGAALCNAAGGLSGDFLCHTKNIGPVCQSLRVNQCGND